ncbi:mechanosensitive ion channel family protein [Halalkalicoccus salilacus]|uniref:mechanosensitive ion channel family protein n=1 Tax=Halalkalicoccus TaxID=332246 RepID=UPI002F9686A2
MLSQWIANAASYLPVFIAGLLIIVVGFIVADFVGDAIERSASNTGSRVGSLLASGV